MKLFPKQRQALNYLEDSETFELLFGGAAGGGKSRLGCYFLVKCCMKYPGTRYLIGRGTLKDLVDSTLNTMLNDVLPAQGLIADEHYKYYHDHSIQFVNGSVILLRYLEESPRDPEFTRLGGLELTAAFVDECNEISIKAWDILKSRIRYKLKDFCHHCATPTIESKEIDWNTAGICKKWLCSKCKKETKGLTPKLLGTCNPSKNWVYEAFYKPFTENALPPHRKFIKSLHKDNPFQNENYEQSLSTMYDEVARNRLLNGLWEFTNDPTDLCDYDSIMDAFTNEHIKPIGNKRLSADLAMGGRDHFVIALWEGNVCTIVSDEAKSDGKGIEDKLRQLMDQYHVSRSNVVADSDGLGGFLSSYLTGIKAFHGNGKTYDKEYQNLKAKCAYKLAEKINKRTIRIICNPMVKQKIIQELGQLKRRVLDGDEQTKAIIRKPDMRDNIHRSPDFLDALIMGQYWDVMPTPLKIYEV